MPRTDYQTSHEYAILLSRLLEARQEADLTQAELADRVGQPQQWVSNVEKGRHRLDVIELRRYCEALGIPFVDFMQALDTEIRRAIPHPGLRAHSEE